MLFLQANLGNLFKILIAVAIYFFFPQIKAVSMILILILCYVDITIFNISFEYQRITLIIARIAKAQKSTNLSIPQIQLLMTNNKIAPLMIIDDVISGVMIGYFLHISFLYLLIYLGVKYLLGTFIPTYKPLSLLFKYVGQELKNNPMSKPHEFIEKVILTQVYEELPHNKNYEQVAFSKYKA